MSEFNPSKKTMLVIDEILDICEQEELSVNDVLDIPPILEKRIKKNIQQLHQQPFKN